MASQKRALHGTMQIGLGGKASLKEYKCKINMYNDVNAMVLFIHGLRQLKVIFFADTRKLHAVYTPTTLFQNQ